jgi:hypothetical protein
MAPDIYEDRTQMTMKRDSSTDVFSFALIPFEILFGVKVFPTTLSAAVIIRKVQGSKGCQLKAGDRPMIPTKVHGLFQELISRGWHPRPDRRPTFADMWKKLREVKFEVFPNVAVEFSPSNPNATINPTDKPIDK